MSTYGWSAKLHEGAAGVKTVKKLLLERGFEVKDVQDQSEWQTRDVDLLVDGVTVEVKTDQYPAKNVALEVTCASGPGCLFKSRAEYWLYYFEQDKLLLWLDLRRLQWFVASVFDKGLSYKRWRVTTIRGDRTWTAAGINVPLDDLRSAGVVMNEVDL